MSILSALNCPSPFQSNLTVVLGLFTLQNKQIIVLNDNLKKKSSRFETDQKTSEFVFVPGAEAIEGAVIVRVSSAVEYYLKNFIIKIKPSGEGRVRDRFTFGLLRLNNVSS